MRGLLGKLALSAAIVVSATVALADDRGGPRPQWPMVPGYGMGQGYPMGPGYHMGPGYGGGYGMGPGMMGYGMMYPGAMHGYGPGPQGATIDANNDGVISETEAAGHFDAAFSAMDANDDAKLTLEEFSAAFYHGGPHMGWREEDVQEWRGRKETRFKEIDANGDGSVTEEEFLAYTKKRFEDSDRDKDGKVTVWEFRGRRYF